MADKAHNETDKILEEIEQHLSAMYEQASKEIEEKAQKYFDQFAEEDEKMRKMVKNGDITEEQYKKWRVSKMMRGKRFADLQNILSLDLLNVNKIAVSYINDNLPEIYSLNFNAVKVAAETAIKGYSFTLINPQVVKNLATRHRTLLPYKKVNGRKDVRWNTKKVNSAVLQGILQGESIPNMAKRLRSVTDMNRASSIRNARTSVTAAENYARNDSYQRIQDDGHQVIKTWTATLDMRTRHEHGMLDGQEKPLNEPFEVNKYKIMLPGDINAELEMVYNCRCRLGRKIVEKKQTERVARVNINGKEKSVLIPYMTYEEWIEWRVQSGNPLYR